MQAHQKKVYHHATANDSLAEDSDTLLLPSVMIPDALMMKVLVFILTIASVMKKKHFKKLNTVGIFVKEK